MWEHINNFYLMVKGSDAFQSGIGQISEFYERVRDLSARPREERNAVLAAIAHSEATASAPATMPAAARPTP